MDITRELSRREVREMSTLEAEDLLDEVTLLCINIEGQLMTAVARDREGLEAIDRLWEAAARTKLKYARRVKTMLKQELAERRRQERKETGHDTASRFMKMARQMLEKDDFDRIFEAVQV